MVHNNKKQNFLQNHDKTIVFGGKIVSYLGGISKFNCIRLLRSWELNRNLYILVGNDALAIFSGSVESLYFCEFSLVGYLCVKSAIFAVKLLLPTHVLSPTCNATGHYSSYHTNVRVPAY